jgi:hypothetical protein
MDRQVEVGRIEAVVIRHDCGQLGELDLRQVSLRLPQEVSTAKGRGNSLDEGEGSTLA